MAKGDKEFKKEWGKKLGHKPFSSMGDYAHKELVNATMNKNWEQNRNKSHAKDRVLSKHKK